MSERDKLIARLRMVDTDDRRLPFHCMRHDAADQMERDRAEIARLREECTRWRQVWDNVQLDVPELRDDNKPLAVAASYELTKRERDEARAALDDVSAAIGTNEFMDPPDGGNVSLAEQVRRMRDALLARVEAAERDAGRYRWLRVGAATVAGPAAYAPWAGPPLFEAELDAAIDAAMEGGK